MSVVIKVTDLSKHYYIGKKQSGSLRETISNAASHLFTKPETQEFWALKDVSFEARQGEVLGIIGKNGAGKSTLLKILSRITEPTEGTVEVEGRVSSLLEVGTGFHPELTGRENTFMNGAILGMKRAEIKRKFDEIVDFSGIEQFIDTPVKHYSSGMYVRLAFAVAAHLEPEILIVDEVLAVGDAEFQKKCLGKMKDVSEQDGRTVLFVSHNMAAVSTLCTKAALLNMGSLQLFGNINEVINAYAEAVEKNSLEIKNSTSRNLAGDDFARLIDIELINQNHHRSKTFYVDETIGINITYEIFTDQINPKISVYLHGPLGEIILCSIDSTKMKNRYAGRISKTLWLPANFLNEGNFSVSVALSTFFPHKLHFYENNICNFVIYDKLDSITRQGYTGPLQGFLRPELKWELGNQIEAENS